MKTVIISVINNCSSNHNFDYKLTVITGDRKTGAVFR